MKSDTDLLQQEPRDQHQPLGAINKTKAPKDKRILLAWLGMLIFIIAFLFVYIAIPIVILTLPFATSEYLYINKQSNVLFLYGYAAFVFLTIILTLLMRSLLASERVLYGGKLIEEFMRLWGNNVKR